MRQQILSACTRRFQTRTRPTILLQLGNRHLYKQTPWDKNSTRTLSQQDLSTHVRTSTGVELAACRFKWGHRDTISTMGLSSDALALFSKKLKSPWQVGQRPLQPRIPPPSPPRQERVSERLPAKALRLGTEVPARAQSMAFFSEAITTELGARLGVRRMIAPIKIGTTQLK